MDPYVGTYSIKGFPIATDAYFLFTRRKKYYDENIGEIGKQTVKLMFTRSVVFWLKFKHLAYSE